MSWHDPKPPVPDFWPIMGLILLVLVVATIAITCL